MKQTDPSSDALFDPLTRRELAILAHLVENKSNPEIASQESLALSSVKWYINQIFSKLGVKNREDAILRAKELGLLKSSSAPPRNNLPRELTSYIGREGEIAQVLRLVRAHALVTVTGSGGSGKTRLALKTAEKILQNSPALFPDGIWLVELAPIASREMVPMAVANALGLSEQHGISPTAALCEFLGSKQVLILLDNCEHVIDAASRLAYELLQACPKLHILATSREILGVEGEAPFRCPSLSLPDLRRPQPVAELAQSESVRLFVERAERISPGFNLSEENGMAIARICQRLDGIPLAIELAAARVRLLSVEQISARLDHTFRLLTGGSRSDLPRHQTLKALIDWSYDLLTEKERLLLLRLSVFAGGWTLEAAEAVCADSPGCDGLLSAAEILDLLGHLLDKSLVEIAPRAVEDEPRYRMLETIRQYANDRLEENTGVETVRDRHLGYCLALSLQAEIELRGKHMRAWREKLDEEMDNLRLAMEWSLPGAVEKGLRLAAALELYWLAYREEEGCVWLERLLAAEAAGPESRRLEVARRAARGKALYVLSGHAEWGRDQSSLAKEATAIFEELGDAYQIDRALSLSLWSPKDRLNILALFRDISEPFYISSAIYPLYVEAILAGNLVQARAYAEENLELNRKIEYPTGEEVFLNQLGFLELLNGNQTRALELMGAAQKCSKAAGESGFFFEDTFLGWLALLQGNYDEAAQILEEVLTAWRRRDFFWIIADVLGGLAWTAWAKSDYTLAEKYIKETLQLSGRLGDGPLRNVRYIQARTAISLSQYEQADSTLKYLLLHWSGYALFMIPIQLVIHAFGILAAAQSAKPGQGRRASVLFGAQDFICSNLMNVMTPPEREAYQQSLVAVRAALSTEDFAAAWAEGQAMNLDQAIQFALDTE